MATLPPSLDAPDFGVPHPLKMGRIYESADNQTSKGSALSQIYSEHTSRNLTHTKAAPERHRFLLAEETMARQYGYRAIRIRRSACLPNELPQTRIAVLSGTTAAGVASATACGFSFALGLRI
jgi:hypothetical protein